MVSCTSTLVGSSVERGIMAETESTTVVPPTGGGGACQEYRVDLTATGFAICKCGYPRDAHVQKQENRASMALKALHKKNVRNEDQYSNGEGKPCSLYRCVAATK